MNVFFSRADFCDFDFVVGGVFAEVSIVYRTGQIVVPRLANELASCFVGILLQCFGSKSLQNQNAGSTVDPSDQVQGPCSML